MAAVLSELNAKTATTPANTNTPSVRSAFRCMTFLPLTSCLPAWPRLVARSRAVGQGIKGWSRARGCRALEMRSSGCSRKQPDQEDHACHQEEEEQELGDRDPADHSEQQQDESDYEQ